MLIPKQRLHLEDRDGQQYCVTKYYVWDTDDCGYIENKAFSFYDTKEECQKQIDLFHSFHIVNA